MALGGDELKHHSPSRVNLCIVHGPDATIYGKQPFRATFPYAETHKFQQGNLMECHVICDKRHEVNVPQQTGVHEAPLCVLLVLEILCSSHDDVIKWKPFPRYWPFVRGIHQSPVNSPHKGQWRWALKFSLICVWINCWVNNRKAGDLRCYRAHYDVIVMHKINFDIDVVRMVCFSCVRLCFICISFEFTLGSCMFTLS